MNPRLAWAIAVLSLVAVALLQMTLFLLQEPVSSNSPAEDSVARARISELERDVNDLRDDLEDLQLLARQPRVTSNPSSSDSMKTRDEPEPPPLEPRDTSEPRPGASTLAAARWLETMFPQPFAGLSAEEAAFLRALDLSGKHVIDADLLLVAELSNLMQLDLAGCPITDQGFATLETLRELSDLDLSGTKVTAAGLSGVCMNGLKALRLNGLPIGDSDFGFLRNYPALEQMKLNRIALTDDAMDEIARCSTLRHVELDETRITAQGLERLLQGNPRLARIEARNTPIDPEALQRLRAQYPDCEIIAGEDFLAEQLRLQLLGNQR